MIRKLTLFLLLAFGALSLKAQYDTLTIQQIQTVPAASLANCDDLSPFEGDTVIVFASVVMDAVVEDPQNPGGPEVPNAQVRDGRNIWLQSGTGPFSGIDLFVTNVPIPVPGIDVLELRAKDSVKVTGIVATFGNESELIPIDIQLVAQNREINYTPISVADLNDDMQVNIFETGEQWEGVYVELTNLRVDARSEFTSGGVDRVSLICSDQNGNLISISDRFLVTRLPAAGGTFVPPPPNATYDTLRGVIAHSGNGCTGNGFNRGYELYPFQASDYVLGVSPPFVTGETRNPTTPTASEDVTVRATIEDPDGTVASASLFYAVGASNENFQELPMTATGRVYDATIPSNAFSDGDIVKYYISATDDSSLTATSPPAAANAPFFFAVNDNGTTIKNVQFTPFDNGTSGYLGLDVTVSGIVTASAQPNDLGFIYIQQPGESAWAGLPLIQNANLATLERGDSVVATGQIRESFGMTRMEVTTVSVISQGAALPDPIQLDPDLFTTYDFEVAEQYEGMLVELKNPTDGNDIYVVETNSDGTRNFGEYRVGSSDLTADGCRVLAGRSDNNSFSSLNFSYINDSLWITNAGVIPPELGTCVVSAGDTISSLTGIMYYSFGNMKLLPRNNDDANSFSGANCPGGIVSSIEDELAGSEIIAYPNPTRDLLTVSYTFPQIVEGNVRMIDLMGRTVANKEIRGVAGELQLQTGNMVAGTYILLVETQGYIISRKRIVVLE